MFSHKKIISLLILIIVAILLVVLFHYRNKSSVVVLAGKPFSVEVVDTDALRQKGLSGHKPLASDEGMLFVFPKPGNYGFWMKDMLFPIDIIWIDSNFRITHIEKSLSVTTYPNIFYPNSPSLYVLEISAGQSDILNVKIGDSITPTNK